MACISETVPLRLKRTEIWHIHYSHSNIYRKPKKMLKSEMAAKILNDRQKIKLLIYLKQCVWPNSPNTI